MNHDLESEKEQDEDPTIFISDELYDVEETSQNKEDWPVEENEDGTYELRDNLFVPPDESKSKSQGPLAIKFSVEARNVHGNRYLYVRVRYLGPYEEVEIWCGKHGMFMMTPFRHLKGAVCPECTIDEDTKLFVWKARLIHGRRFVYRLTRYIRVMSKVIIICRKHGSFKQTPNRHLAGTGCKACAVEKQTKTQEQFQNQVLALFGRWYTFESTVYTGIFDPVTLTCPIHGPFTKLASNILNSRQGCPTCGRNVNGFNHRSNKSRFIISARMIYGDRFGYDDVVYETSKIEVVINCKRHGPFRRTPSLFLLGQACPGCAKAGYSPISLEWITYIEITRKLQLKCATRGGEYRIPGTSYRADGYDADTKTVYEFHGDYWHGNPNRYEKEALNNVVGKTFGELYERTIEKERRVTSLGYKYVSIWESEWKEMRKTLPDEILSEIKSRLREIFDR